MTTNPPAVPLQPETNRPEFLRLPKPGNLCPYTGLSRSYLNNLVLPCKENGFRPPVRSVSLRRPGQTKGVRLVVFDSLMEFLRGHLEGATGSNLNQGESR